MACSVGAGDGYGVVLMKNFWRFVWNLSEWTGIGLGRFAPFVFGKMIGREGHRTDENNTN